MVKHTRLSVVFSAILTISVNGENLHITVESPVLNEVAV